MQVQDLRAMVLSVSDLRVEFPDRHRRWRPVVDGLSFEARRGEAFGLIGDSGAGKTMTGLSLLGLVPPPGRVTGSIRLLGRELVGLQEREWWSVRGQQVGMVFQDALSGLNPVRSIGSQLSEVAGRRYAGFPRAQARRWARERALETLQAVGVPEPRARLGDYPHQLSGGLRQRVMIALAIVNAPPLIVADEPTTALDTTLRAQIVELLRGLLGGSALVVITHDLGLAASLCDRVGTIYAGRLVERGPVEPVLTAPRHPYTAALLAAVPRLGSRELPSPIPGQPPGFGQRQPGCAFAPRCPNAVALCARQAPPLEPIDGRMAACWNPVRE